MSKPAPKKGKGKKKAQRKSMTLFFVKGLGALLPIVLTIFVFVTVVNFARTYVTKPINNTIYWSLESNGWGWKALDKLAIDPLDPRPLAPPFTLGSPLGQRDQPIGPTTDDRTPPHRHGAGTYTTTTHWPCWDFAQDQPKYEYQIQLYTKFRHHLQLNLNLQH